MTAVLVVALIGLWVAVLWPLWSQVHRKRSHEASMARWNSALRVLSNRPSTRGGVSRSAAAPFGLSATRVVVDTPTAPKRRTARPLRTPAQRRLVLLQGLLGLFAVALLLALAVSGVFWVLALPALAGAAVVTALGRQVAAADARRARAHAAARRSASAARLQAAVAGAAPVFASARTPDVAVLDEDDFAYVDRTVGYSRSTVLRETAPARDDERLVPAAFQRSGASPQFRSARVTGHSGPLFLQATGVDLDAEPVADRDADLDLVVARVLQRRSAG